MVVVILLSPKLYSLRYKYWSYRRGIETLPTPLITATYTSYLGLGVGIIHWSQNVKVSYKTEKEGHKNAKEGQKSEKVYRKTEKEGQKRAEYLGKLGKRVRKTKKRVRKVILCIRKSEKCIRKNI